ncbi:hypothetical protein MHYP_G00224110 [Metynnis hypsauchen]
MESADLGFRDIYAKPRAAPPSLWPPLDVLLPAARALVSVRPSLRGAALYRTRPYCMAGFRRGVLLYVLCAMDTLNTLAHWSDRQSFSTKPTFSLPRQLISAGRSIPPQAAVPVLLQMKGTLQKHSTQIRTPADSIKPDKNTPRLIFKLLHTEPAAVENMTLSISLSAIKVYGVYSVDFCSINSSTLKRYLSWISATIS